MPNEEETNDEMELPLLSQDLGEASKSFLFQRSSSPVSSQEGSSQSLLVEDEVEGF